MPLTTLDPKTALILVDLQKGIVAVPLAHPVEGIITNAQALLEAFRDLELPVVLVNVAGGAPGRTEQPRVHGTRAEGWTKLIPELNQQPSDHLVTKHSPGSFIRTGLDEYLRGAGVTQVVVGGISTSNGVESTARQAYELGYNVTLAIDAMTDRTVEAHENSLTKIFPRIGETGTTAQVIELLKSTRT